jgi:bilirubin oxidase
MLRSLHLLILLIAISLKAQNPIAIPPLIEADTFQLNVGAYTHQFYPGVNTATFGVDVPYLGPTLLFHKGDTARLRVNNQLNEVTNMHWHGMKVPGVMDGGPHREVLPGEHWDVKFNVENPAGTFWYHPHTHMQTGTQATKGIAGFIIVQDDVEGALELPRTYGVDDFPVVIQDRRFDANGQFLIGPFGDSILVNGTPHPYLEVPAQTVRLRVLNGSNARIYELGFENGESFNIIAGDAGLLPAPVEKTRQRLSNGERIEMLLDLTGMEGDSLLLMSFSSELTSSMPGAYNPILESSILNGADFPVLRLRVVAPTPDPVMTIPAQLVPSAIYDETASVRHRFKILNGTGMAGMGMFMIDGLMYDINLINDTMQVGTVETWTIMNASNLAHPMHIHGVSFYMLERNMQPPPLEEQGPKDVVLIGSGEQVQLIMKFDHASNGWPFMYHCHNLMHEDNMMMLQYIVVDGNTSVPANRTSIIGIYPSPANSTLQWKSPFQVQRIRVHDIRGAQILDITVNAMEQGHIDVSALAPGLYSLEMIGLQERAVGRIVKE